MEIGKVQQFSPPDLINSKKVEDKKSDKVKEPVKSDSDSLKVSGSASAKPSKSVLSNISMNLTGLGDKLVNQPVLDHYKSFRNDPKYQPIIAEVDKVVKNGGSIKDLEKTAFKAAKENNPNLSKSEILAKGYRAILSSVISNRYSDPKFFNGEKDKVFHYFVSSSMTVDAFNGLKYSLFMPDSVKKAVAGNSVLTMGWLKEVASIPGNGYGEDDMQANRAGIASAQNYLSSNK